jgi:hypothetical protein
MNCHEAGTATITITAEHNGVTYSEDVTITVKEQVSVNFVNVNTAINTAVGETVTVKGIVGPSLVNKVGFYLIDETGVIAVRVDAETMKNIEIGHEVVMTGTRSHFAGKGTAHGQTCLMNAVVVSNNYGEHSYSAAAFKGEISVAEFRNLNATEDYSTSVFVVKATVTVNETAYYTNIKLTGAGTEISLYCSSANQYGWLKAYAGQEVTMEIAPCNWNEKDFYAGCVLAVINADGTKTLNTLNFD